MEAVAFSKENRISAQKVRLIANEVRGIELPDAMDMLRSMPQKAARIVLKTI